MKLHCRATELVRHLRTSITRQAERHVESDTNCECLRNCCFTKPHHTSQILCLLRETRDTTVNLASSGRHDGESAAQSNYDVQSLKDESSVTAEDVLFIAVTHVHLSNHDIHEYRRTVTKQRQHYLNVHTKRTTKTEHDSVLQVTSNTDRPEVSGDLSYTTVHCRIQN